MKLLASLLLCSMAVTAAVAASPPYVVATRIAVDGPTRWDYVHVDPRRHRLYVAHGTQIDIIDTERDTVVGRLADTRGVHGVAVADDLGLVFTSDGADGDIGVYGLAGGPRIRSIKAGANPDAIVYEPVSHRVIAFNGRSHDATIADAASGAVQAASIPLGGKPEFAVVDGRGLVYVNIEDSAEIAVLDARSGTVVKRYSIAPCDSPTGLDIDPQGRLYSVCGNALMIVSDPIAGRVLGQARIGLGPDGVVWLDGHAVSANGRDGSASVVGETTPLHFETLATVPTAAGARTIAADRALHKLYLPTADFRPEPAVAEGQRPRRAAVAGSFHVIVLRAP